MKTKTPTICDLLAIGKEQPTTGKDLAAALGCDIRDVTAAIERERRAGAQICAGNDGYYLAANKGEAKRYARRLYKRASNLMKTYRCLKDGFQNLPDE